ncbi:MAG: hypothetical protein AAGD96_04915 [Chloroflexota bacterium]
MTNRTDIEVVISTRSKPDVFGASTVPFKFALVQVGIDTFVGASLDHILAADVVCALTPFWLDWAADYYAQRGEHSAYDRLSEKMVFCGFPFLDALKRIDRSSLYEKFDIPQNKNVILLLPITLENKPGAWAKFFKSSNPIYRTAALLYGIVTEGADLARYFPWISNGWHDDKLNESIRSFCDANNGWLIAKGRHKDPIRPSLLEIADQIVYDDQDYPATVLQLMSISAACIHFYSTAALELAYLGVPGICLDRPSPRFKEEQYPPLFHRLWRLNYEYSAYNWPGINLWLSLPQAFNSLQNTQLSHIKFDKDEQVKYLQKYVDAQYQAGQSNLSGKRILDSVTQLAI